MRNSLTATCLICQTDWELNESRENSHLYCQMCRKKSERKIDYGHADPCIPWNGDFDEYDNPMKNGQFYLPGPRSCGHKDCVQKAHISWEPTPMTPQEATLERYSIAYRTKKALTYEQFMARLEAERPKKVTPIR